MKSETPTYCTHREIPRCNDCPEWDHGCRHAPSIGEIEAKLIRADAALIKVAQIVTMSGIDPEKELDEILDVLLDYSRPDPKRTESVPSPTRVPARAEIDAARACLDRIDQDTEPSPSLVLVRACFRSLLAAVEIQQKHVEQLDYENYRLHEYGPPRVKAWRESKEKVELFRDLYPWAD